MATYNSENPTKEGPWGGKAGVEWNFKPSGPITEITINYGSLIDALTFKSDDGKGKVESSKKFGGEGGGTTKIPINWSREYLTSISGTYDRNSSAIQSISFITNLTTYGPFGPTDGTPFSYSSKDSVIVGFYGLASNLVDAIGIYVKKYEDLFKPPGPLVVTPQVDNGKTMNTDLPRKAGPWGGSDGKPWDDGRFPAIKQVDVHVVKDIVRAVTIQYQSKDGKSTVSKKYGGAGGDAVYTIKVDGSSEYLVGIMGFYGSLEENGGSKAVRSLSFYTNKGKYGPFGKQIGTFFSSPVSDGKVVGFHGRSGEYLDAVGVHLQYS